MFGAPRSGTTLMKLILGAHPNLTGLSYETGIFMYK
ncbi:sulfotransferase [Okeania sp. SIO2B3]|nr:sulfotransferase [Okeania sp. SIO2B3]